MTHIQKILLVIIPACFFWLGLLNEGGLPPAQASSVKTKSKARAAADMEIPIPVRHLLKHIREAMDKEDWPGVITLIESARPGAGGADAGAPCSHPLVCLALGNSHLMGEDHDHAEAAYLAALDMDKDFMDARINLAKVYADSRQYAKASEAFLAAYEGSDPKNCQFLYYSGVMALMDGQTDKSVKRLSLLFSAHPEKVTLQWKETFANALMTAKLWKRAIPLVRELAGLTRGEARLKWQETLLQIYLTVDDKPAALKLATTLSRQSPAEPRWWKALVHIRLGMGDYDKALDDLIIYGFITPLTPKEKKLMADLSLQLQVPDRAARTYESLLARRGAADKQTAGTPTKSLVNNLITAYRQLGRGDRALSLIARFDPKACDPELLLLKGDILYETKNYEAADKAFRAAAAKNCPRKGQAWLMAGYAAWQCNDLVASRTAFEQAARYKRHRKTALAAIDQLKKTHPM